MEYETSSKKIPPIILIAAILQIVFIILLIAIIITEVNKKPQIDNRDDQPKIAIEYLTLDNLDLPDNYLKDISHSLTDAIELNSNNFDISKLQPTIRKDSVTLKEFNNQQFNALSFIVDIPELEQSYQIYYKYPINVNVEDIPFFNNPRAVLCLDEKSQIIYPDFKCHSALPSNTRYKIAQDYINFLEFNNFSIYIDNEAPHQINLKPFRYATGTLNESHIAQVKIAIESLGISPDIFTYKIIK